MPQFMSTHPNDASRLKELEAFLPEARKYYVPAPGGPRPAPARTSGGNPAPLSPRRRALDSGPPIIPVPA